MERHHPGASQLYQERGHCYVAVKDAPRAIEAYGRAVQINPALPAAWSMLEGLYRMVGDEEHRRVAVAHAKKLKSMPPEVITATGLFCEGELAASERLIRAFLLRHGDHVEAMRLLARIGVARDILDDAEVLLAAALEMAPDYVELRRDYACVLLDRHKHADAIAQLDRLLQLDPKNIDYRTLRATATVGLGDHEGGVRGFSDVLADTSPESRLAADLHLSIAHSLKTLGRRVESIDEYKKAIEVRPNFGDAYWSLANLKTYEFSAEEIARLEAAEADPSTALIDRYPPVLRARQGVRGPPGLRGVLPLLRARQRAQARREPLSAGAPGAETPRTRSGSVRASFSASATATARPAANRSSF